MDNKEKFIAKTKGGKTRRLAKTGTKLRIGATKKAMGPVGGLPVDEKGLKVFTGKEGDLPQKKAGGGLAEATAKLKAKGFEDGGMVVKDKIVSIDTSPNSGLITTKGFGASRRT